MVNIKTEDMPFFLENLDTMRKDGRLTYGEYIQIGVLLQILKTVGDIKHAIEQVAKK